jgi:hypothetical protein
MFRDGAPLAPSLAVLPAEPFLTASDLPMRLPFLTRPALVLLAFVAAACADRSPTAAPPPDPVPPKAPTPVGVFEITVTAIGTDAQRATVSAVRPEGAASATLTPVPTGISFEQVSTGSFVEGSRTGGGQRYLTFTFRVRNGTGGALNNLTVLMVSRPSTISGTPLSLVKKFDGTNVDSALAKQVVPTGVTGLGSDLVTMQSPYPDVLQVFSEGEVAAITPPGDINGIFPYGYVVRNKASVSTRTLPATADPNQWDGVMTLSFRVPLQATSSQDLYQLTFQVLGVTDGETRMTESIEESQDTGAVRRLRDRATSLGATTVTVLNGSAVVDPAVPDYPGQRQICSPRTAGTPASPLNNIVAPGAYSQVSLLTPGEGLDTCTPYFRTGTASRPATNVPFTVTLKAMDRYGNVKTGQADTLHLVETNGVPAVASAAASLVLGSVSETVTYSNYGTSVLMAQGKRLSGVRTIPVAGVVRTWTAGAGTTSWHTAGNWSPAAVPMSLDSVYVPVAAPLFPALAANVQIGGVTVENTATISLNAFDMTASANVTAGTSGGITNSSGRLFLAGTAKTVEGRVPVLRVTGTYSLTANVTSRAPIQVDAGRLTVSALRLQADSN